MSRRTPPRASQDARRDMKIIGRTSGSGLVVETVEGRRMRRLFKGLQGTAKAPTR